MGIKEIFENGMKELRRKSSLHKEKRVLKQKEENYEEQLRVLGQKAWEARVNIDAYADLKELLTNAQKQEDDLNARVKGLEEQKQAAEEKKKQENEQFDSQRKEVEDKKKGVDERLGAEKKVLKEAQKEVDDAKKRLGQIAAETDRLNKKAAAADTPEEEKKEIPKKLEALEKEKGELDGKVSAKTGEVGALTEKVKPIQEESDRLQQEIDKIKEKQKEVIGELDQSLSDMKKQMQESNDELKKVDKNQQENFKLLGERLAAGGVTDPGVASEMAAVQTAEKEMTDVRVGIEKLEQQGSSASRSAFWQMIGIVAGGLVLLIIIIVGLILLLKSGDKGNTAGNGDDTAGVITESKTKEPGGEKVETAEDAVKKMGEVTGMIKERSEQIHGKIVVADKETLSAALPDIRGWKMKPPSYGKQSFQGIEMSQLSAVYTGPDSREVEASILDTATASAMLQSMKIILMLNRTVENEDGYEKITTYRGMKAVEKYEKQGQRARISFIVRDRYLVHLTTRGEKSMETLKDFMAKFDFSKLK
jgi:uncharacterized coiled-coil DUF342 family protein